MTTRTITRLYDNHAEAVTAVQALEAAGFSHDDVSIVANNADSRYANGTTATDPTESVGDAGAGATAGTIFGGGLGLMAGIGALAIPGVGPVVAAGWLVATLAGAGVGAAVGAGTGGLIGALTHEGVPEHDAHVYAESVRRGGSLVTARVDETRVAEAERILDQRTAVDVAARRMDYEKAGWKNFDDTSGPYVSGSTQAHL
jgi:hypothetical protein